MPGGGKGQADGELLDNTCQAEWPRSGTPALPSHQLCLSSPVYLALAQMPTWPKGEAAGGCQSAMVLAASSPEGYPKRLHGPHNEEPRK